MILVLATIAFARRGVPAPRRGREYRSWTIVMGGSILLGALSVSVVLATHTVITANDATWAGTNGWRVYLSSPRHSNSRFRGECGWEENINGRHWNYNATHANGGGDGGLLRRGYSVTVSANARDDGAWININSSNNWGANVHIVTHTNAYRGCPDVAQYLLVMFETGSWGSTDLTNHLLTKLDPALPGGTNSWDCDHLGECTQTRAGRSVYVELFFHDNQASVNWWQTAGVPEANTWRYGWAVDAHLGYP